MQFETTSIALFEPLYNLSQNELEVLQEYIADNLAKEFIQSSIFSTNASVLFIKKKDSNLLLCVDY